MSVGRALGSLLLAALACLAPAKAASAATVEIGAVAEIRADTPPTEPSGGGGTVQLAETAGTYAVLPGYGVITALEHRTGSVGGALTFKVYRPVGVRSFLTVASLPRTVTAGTLHTFAVRIPARPGDRLGLFSADDTVHLAYQTFNPGDRFAFFAPGSNPAPGTTVEQDGNPAVGYKLDVLAKVETDADGDGFGDDTQDRCPTSAATQGACGAAAPLPAFAGCSSRVANLIRGTAAANTITGTARADRIFAAGGADRVAGSGGTDCIDLGSGNDRGSGGSGSDLMLGASGRDRLSGGPGRDRLYGGSGGDRISGGSSADRISGGAGADWISSGSGSDRISARDRRRDRISCGSGRDSVTADRVDRVARDCERVRRR